MLAALAVLPGCTGAEPPSGSVEQDTDMVECPAASDGLKACFDKALSACRNGFMVVMPADALEPDGGIDAEARMVARCTP